MGNEGTRGEIFKGKRRSEDGGGYKGKQFGNTRLTKGKPPKSN